MRAIATKRRLQSIQAFALATCVVAWAKQTLAEEPTDKAQELVLTKKEQRLVSATTPYAHTFASLSLGTGMRFNNPYRLASVLGDTAESLSLTAAFVDASGGLAFGDARGLQHGSVIHVGTSLSGVAQPFVSLSYVLLYNGFDVFVPLARIGPAMLVAPDVNFGGELAGGGAWMISGALGVSAELVFNLYYGAATLDTATTTIPVLSLQLGVFLDYEVIP